MPDVYSLSVQRRDRGDWTIITLEGEIDWDTAPLARSVIGTCLHTRHDVDIDLAAVTFCDASGLNLFLASLQDATAAGRQLVLSHPTPEVSRLFALAGTGYLLRGSPAMSPAGPRGAPALRSAS